MTELFISTTLTPADQTAIAEAAQAYYATIPYHITFGDCINKDNHFDVIFISTNAELEAAKLYYPKATTVLCRPLQELTGVIHTPFLLCPIQTNDVFVLLDSLAINQWIEIYSRDKTSEVTFIKEVNYIDIQQRCLCFHLDNKPSKYSLSITKSFEAHVSELTLLPHFYMAGTALMVNLMNICKINSQEVIFKDGTKCYPPKARIERLKEVWLAGAIRLGK